MSNAASQFLKFCAVDMYDPLGIYKFCRDKLLIRRFWRSNDGCSP